MPFVFRVQAHPKGERTIPIHANNIIMIVTSPGAGCPCCLGWTCSVHCATSTMMRRARMAARVGDGGGDRGASIVEVFAIPLLWGRLTGAARGGLDCLLVLKSAGMTGLIGVRS